MKRQWIVYVSIFLAACSDMQERPATIGTGTDDLKRSPCASGACGPVFYRHGQWVSHGS